MMTKEDSTKMINFMTPGAGVLVLGHDHKSHIVKIHHFYKKSSEYKIREGYIIADSEQFT